MKVKITRFISYVIIVICIAMNVSCKNYSEENTKIVDDVVNQLIKESLIQDSDIIYKDNETIEFEISPDEYYYKVLIEMPKCYIELSHYCYDYAPRSKYKMYVSIYIPIIFENESPLSFSLDDFEISDIINRICYLTLRRMNFEIIKYYFNVDYLITNFNKYSYISENNARIAQYECITRYADISYILTNISSSINDLKEVYPLKYIDSTDGYLVITFSHNNY